MAKKKSKGTPFVFWQKIQDFEQFSGLDKIWILRVKDGALAVLRVKDGALAVLRVKDGAECRQSRIQNYVRLRSCTDRTRELTMKYNTPTE